jgi:hypothetical protein
VNSTGKFNIIAVKSLEVVLRSWHDGVPLKSQEKLVNIWLTSSKCLSLVSTHVISLDNVFKLEIDLELSPTLPIPVSFF